MANLKEVRKRIASVDTTKQITSAMKLVAASRLRKAQQSLLSFRPYAIKMKEMLLSLTQDIDDIDENPYLTCRETEKVLLIAVTSNRGLCGAFNNNIIKAVKTLIEGKYLSQYNAGNVHLITIGKTVTNFYKKRKFNIIGSYDEIYDNLTYDKVYEIADIAMRTYAEGKYDRVEILYNKFKNAAVQVVSTEQFLPVMSDFSIKSDEIDLGDEEKNSRRMSRATGSGSAVGGGSMPSMNMNEMRATTKDIDFGTNNVKGRILNDYIYEPNKEEIVNQVIPKTLKVQFYRVLLESYASEHGARMTAMHQATDNATEIIKQLTIEYNKARQAAITNEIIEIVSGANALGG